MSLTPLEEVRQTTVALLQGLTGEDGRQNPQEIIAAIGLGDQAEDVQDMIEVLDHRATERAIEGVLKGDIEELAHANSSALLVAFVIGYRLGCAHTAERMEESS